MNGWWEAARAPASVDWCEPNYALVAWVAELFNTVSSLYIAALGVFGLVAWRRSPVVGERRFAWGFVGLMVVGLGSAAFHGTLERWAQALDELPMVWLGLVGVWTVQRRDLPSRGADALAWGFLGYAILFTAGYLLVPSYFELFIGTYAALVAWTVIVSARHTWLRPSAPVMRWLFVAASLTYLGSLALCWIPEHVLLPCDHWLQGAQLHAWWHFGAGTGTYLWLLWAIADRRFLEGRTLTLDGRWPPFLVG